MQPNTKMSSGQATFDLKAARQMCAELPGRDKLPLPDRIDREERVLRLFPAALDEIGRLRKALALKTEQHKGQAHVIGSYLGMLADFNELNESQTKRIAGLEAGIEERDDTTGMLLARNATYRTALRKLGERVRARGKALVEERAWSIFNEIKLGSRQDIPYQDVAEYYEVTARGQLRREGKL